MTQSEKNQLLSKRSKQRMKSAKPVAAFWEQRQHRKLLSDQADIAQPIVPEVQDQQADRRLGSVASVDASATGDGKVRNETQPEFDHGAAPHHLSYAPYGRNVDTILHQTIHVKEDKREEQEFHLGRDLHAHKPSLSSATQQHARSSAPGES